MLRLFEARPNLFRAWRLVQFEQVGKSHRLVIDCELIDGSRLSIRDYVFTDGKRKYAYHWMETDGTLRRRWDNAPHWQGIATGEHHLHKPGSEMPGPSSVTNIEDLLAFVEEWLASPDS
ncbi:MAG: hypothetical protein J5I90_07120 [Caldilineales bacterium]|nr:hypothetical protein [Caldilineales bacterium]